MIASSNLALEFEPEIASSIIQSDNYSSIWGDRTFTNTTMVTIFELSETAKQFIAKLNSFKSLRHNWDSYGAIPPSSENIDRAISFIRKADKNLLPFYFTAPGPNGELVLEFRNGNKEASVFINPDGTNELILNEGKDDILEGTLEENYKDLLSFVNG